MSDLRELLDRCDGHVTATNRFLRSVEQTVDRNNPKSLWTGLEQGLAATLRTEIDLLELIRVLLRERGESDLLAR